MLWFLDISARAGWVVDRYQDEATGTLARNTEGQQAMTQVVLRPAVQFAPGKTPTAEELQALHHRAHASCFIANSVKTEVVCEPVLSPSTAP